MQRSKAKAWKKKISAEIYFRRYLKIAPLALALWRSVEAKHFSRVTYKHPILDLGCGFGEFAEAFVEKGDMIDLGVDNAPFDLLIAAKGGRYKNLLYANAASIPIKEKSFATVMSVSTFEHIQNVQGAIKESYRILKPGGKLIVSIETDKVDINTFYRPYLKKIGLNFLSIYCSKLYNTLFHRKHLYSKEYWEKKIKKVGFTIEVSKDIISPEVTRLFDIFLITAWPAQVFRSLFGKRMVYRPQFIDNLLTKIFLKYIVKEERIGTNLFVVARKPRDK